MSSPRRDFVKTGVLAILASGVPISIHRLAQAQTPWTSDALRHFDLADFAACIDSWFTIERDGRPVDRIRLVRVVDLRLEAVKNDPALEWKECFALIFSGGGRGGSLDASFRRAAAGPHDRRVEATPSSAFLADDRPYQLRHDRLGEFPLSLAPAGSDEDRPLYAAVINRLYP